MKYRLQHHGAPCQQFRSKPLVPTMLRTAQHRVKGAGQVRKAMGGGSEGQNYKEAFSISDPTPTPQPGVQRPTDGAAANNVGADGRLKIGSITGGKYTVVEVLGSGSNATTYKALTPDGEEVAIKALSLRAMRDWKVLELFQREAQILKSLSHPGIPRYLDYYEDDSEQDRCFCLVQEVVKGKSLAEMVSSSQRADDAEVERIAGKVLEVLGYLGGLRPPVIHRDVKPENIVLEGGRWGGRVVLVDFGAVQGMASIAGGLAPLGSTIVGTYGYMAPEQFQGAAQPASDLYGLGATLLFLLSGQPPSSFPQERMRLQWRSSLPALPPRLAALLEGLLEPLAEDRLTVAQAQALLRGEPLAPPPRSSSSSSGGVRGGGFDRRRAQVMPLPPRPAGDMVGSWLEAQQGMMSGAPVRQPAGSHVILTRTPTRLDVNIPPKGFTGDTVATGGFAVAWNAFVAFWTFSALAGGGILMALFSVPFWFAGAQLVNQFLGGALMRERFAVGLRRFKLGRQLAVFGKDGQATFEGGDSSDDESSSRQGSKVIAEGAFDDLLGARVVTTVIVNGSPQFAVELVAGVNKYRFAESLEVSEQQWIAQEINSWLGEVRGRTLNPLDLPPPDKPQVYQDTEDAFQNQ